MRVLRLVLVTVFVSAGMLVAEGAGPAFACSCAYQSDRDFVGGADEIFVGTLISMADPPERKVMSSTDPITYTVSVDAVYRGDVGTTAVFESPMSGASCGLEGMVVDRRYLVFLGADGSRRTASLCGGTAPATPGRVDAVERLAGAPAQPAVTADPTAAEPDTVVRATKEPTREQGVARGALSSWIIATTGLIGVVALLGAGRQLRRRAPSGRARHH